ncbi:MAG: hypothetical protein KAU17_07815 [Spirochaetales bacterium]|nr:hypothetical protein [Spirochaetales bacterium]
MMKKLKTHYYLIDNLTSTNAEKLTVACNAIPNMADAVANVMSGVLTIKGGYIDDKAVKLACQFVGVSVRMKLKKRDAKAR